MLIFHNIKKEFPLLSKKTNGTPLVYLDSAATTQKPEVVLRAMDLYYRNSNANVHRGIYSLAEEATELYEDARATVAQFIHAQEPAEIIFTANATEAINLVAESYGKTHVQEGGAIVVSELEHHSNLLPWQRVTKEKEASLFFIPLRDDGTFDLNAYEKLLDRRVKLVAVTGLSNVLGVVPDLSRIVSSAHARGAKVLVDGAQLVPTQGVDVQKLDADFLAFSGHKIYGPMGIGVLYGKRELLGTMPPFIVGGGMIGEVEKEQASLSDIPWKFEGGTPNVAGAVGLAAAIGFMTKIGHKKIHEYGKELTDYAYEKLSRLPYISLYGPGKGSERGHIISFNVKRVHAHDVAEILDSEGIAIRAGHHCAQPLMKRLGVPATCRVSFGVYNTREDIERLMAGLDRVQRMFKMRR